MSLQPKKVLSGLLVSVFLITMLQACSAGLARSDAESINKQLDSVSFEESQKAFADHNPAVVSRIGKLNLTTRMATPAEIPKDEYKTWLQFPAEGAGSFALGLVAPPLYASGLVVGGVFLVPLGTFGYIHDKRIWDSINGALSNAEFTRAIDRAMKDRLIADFTKERMPDLKIEVIIQTFGIVDTASRLQHCLTVSADFILSRENAELKRDHLQITNLNRNEDAPPPQCASLEHFAKNEARFIKDTLAEYAEVLAVMVTDRIPREDGK